ncbi:MAG TPA: DNA polymerase III subunit delta [Vicinamibacterales bacterium]|nr:DNA polymerase III subunit delta [Vicinamibacterales bacterium]
MAASPVTPARLLQEISAGRVRPVCLLTGPDDQMKAEIVARTIGTIEEALRPFNVDKIYPADSREEARRQFWGLMRVVRTPPMLAPRRVAVVARAEKLMDVFRQGDDEGSAPEPRGPAKRGRRPAAAGEAELAALEAYLDAPSPDCALIFVAGETLKAGLKAVRLIERTAAVVPCDPLAGAEQAVAWVKDAAAGEGVRVERAAAELLAELSGGDIGRLRTEFERALLFASGEGIITKAAVQEIAGAPTTQNTWAMTNAIQRRDAAAALRQLALKLGEGEAPYMILGQLAWYARDKAPNSRVGTAIEAVFRTDLALKTSGGDPRVLLERLVVELCG